MQAENLTINNKAIEFGKQAYEMDMRKLEISEKKRNDRIVLFCILFLFAIAAGCFGISMYLEKKEEAKHIDHIQITRDSKDFKGENYEGVMDNFEAAGFSNIEVEGLEDLVTGWITKEDTVDSVSINGDDDFEEGDYFPKSAKVKILYHSFPEDKE